MILFLARKLTLKTLEFHPDRNYKILLTLGPVDSRVIYFNLKYDSVESLAGVFTCFVLSTESRSFMHCKL